MSGVVKPMLAKDGDLSKITYPVVVQPKLDGIRCLIVDGVARSRTFKPIPNQEIQDALGRPEFEGLDGELIVGEPTAEGCMQTTTSFVMASNKTDEPWTYHVFDKWDEPGGFWNRFQAARDALFPVSIGRLSSRCCIVPSENSMSAAHLDAVEGEMVRDGHEGIIVRDPSAPYKHGRSGVKGPLLKVKRFIDFEAVITGVYEEQENTNEATKDYRHTEKLQPGDPCEFHYPARSEWLRGTVVRNGGAGYWHVRDETHREDRFHQVSRSLYIEHVRAVV